MRRFKTKIKRITLCLLVMLLGTQCRVISGTSPSEQAPSAPSPKIPYTSTTSTPTSTHSRSSPEEKPRGPSSKPSNKEVSLWRLLFLHEAPKTEASDRASSSEIVRTPANSDPEPPEREVSLWRLLFLQETDDSASFPSSGKSKGNPPGKESVLVKSFPLNKKKPDSLPAPKTKETFPDTKPALTSSVPANETTFLWGLLSQAEEQLRDRMENDADMATVHKVLASSCTPPPDSRRLLAVVQHAEADALQQKTGLELRGAYTMGDFTDDPGDADAYLELSWNLLRNGYRENRGRAAALHRKARITELRGRVSQDKRSHRCRRARIANHFSALYAELLEMQLRLMEPVLTIERRAYFKGRSFLDDYLVSKKDLRLLRRELKYLQENHEALKISTTLVNPPVIDIDMHALIQAIQNDTRNSQINRLEKAALGENRKVRHRNRLRIFFRKSFEVGGASGRDNREGIGAGLRFQIPLDPETNDVDRWKLRQADEEQAMREWERVARARSAYLRLREETARQIELTYRYEQARERVRQVFVKKNLGDENLLALTVNRVRTLLSSSIAILRSKVALYQRTNDIFMAAGLDYRPELIKLSVQDDASHRARPGERAIYLWSEAFNGIPNRQIIDFLEAKRIETVLLSAGGYSERVKLKQFYALAKHKKWTVALIAGANEWIYPRYHNRAAVSIASAAELTGRVHLDIEPHVLKGYREQPEVFLNNYLDLLRRARILLGDRRMSVSVPLHWEHQTYEKVGHLVDKVYIMSDGSEKPDTLIRRLEPVLTSLPPEKVVLVLRADDFADEWAMEGAMEQITSRTGINRFAIHQFKTFLRKAGIQQ